jgi:enamine deaminase RidA (YjgF/YER057c/UK114 family)
MKAITFNRDAAISGAIGGAVAIASIMIAGKFMCRGCMRGITRLRIADPRSSGIVKYNGTAIISGQVGIIDELAISDITDQTRQALAKIDDLLAEAGTSKSRLIEARIWVKSVPEHFALMNEVWNSWVDPENKPARFCVESSMARPNILVEIQVVAACDSKSY